MSPQPKKRTPAAAAAKQASIKIDPQRRIVVSTFFGPVTDEVLLSHGREMAAHEQFDAKYAEIVDFSAAETGGVSETTLAAIAQAKSLFHESVPHVIVAPSNAMAALARKYQQISAASRPKLFVVRSLKEAYQLLALQGYG